MSKSLGNVISPDNVINKYGADILRLWVVASNYSEDLKIDDSILEQHSQSYRKIRNTLRFLLGNLNDDVDFDTSVEIDQLEEIEKYVLHRIASMDSSFDTLNHEYEFHKIYIELLNFCTLDLSALYFDIRKDSLYCDDLKSLKRTNCIKVLSIILKFLMKWLSPILVYTCEEIFQIIKKENFCDSIFLYKFNEFPASWIDISTDQKWKFLKELRSEINNSIETKRNEKVIGSSLEANVHIQLDEKYNKFIEQIDLQELFICSQGSLNNSAIEFEKVKCENNIENLKIVVTKSIGKKCDRCWKVLQNKCDRCLDI